MERLVNITDMLFNHMSPVHREAGFPGEDMQTLQLKD